MTHGGTAAGRRWTERAGRLARALGVVAAIVALVVAGLLRGLGRWARSSRSGPAHEAPRS